MIIDLGIKGVPLINPLSYNNKSLTNSIYKDNLDMWKLSDIENRFFIVIADLDIINIFQNFQDTQLFDCMWSYANSDETRP